MKRNTEISQTGRHQFLFGERMLVLAMFAALAPLMSYAEMTFAMADFTPPPWGFKS